MTQACDAWGLHGISVTYSTRVGAHGRASASKWTARWLSPTAQRSQEPGRSVSLRRPVCIVSCGTANRTARATGCVGPSSRLKRLHCRSAQILPQPRPCCQPTTLGMVTFSLFRLPLPACWEGEGYRALAWADAATSASHGDLSCSGALPPRAEGSSAPRAEGTAQHQEYGQHQEEHAEYSWAGGELWRHQEATLSAGGACPPGVASRSAGVRLSGQAAAESAGLG